MIQPPNFIAIGLQRVVRWAGSAYSYSDSLALCLYVSF